MVTMMSDSDFANPEERFEERRKTASGLLPLKQRLLVFVLKNFKRAVASCKLNDAVIYNGLATESGPVQLASVGVSISIFNIVSKLFNIPFLSVATSFVAEDIPKNSSRSSSQGGAKRRTNGNDNDKAFVDIAERKQLASVSTTLLLAVVIGIFEGLALCFGSKVFLKLMGISSVLLFRLLFLEEDPTAKMHLEVAKQTPSSTERLPWK
ncbi:hypothetical protein Ccrd_015229, partial [Cynara cardunculus var. scolymus]